MRRRIFDDEHEMFRESVRRFILNEVTPNLEKWYEQDCVDREAFAKAGANGLLLVWADEEYGGAGIEDFRYEQIILEENAYYGNLGFGMSIHSRLVGKYLGELGTDEQKERFLPACAAGENILGIAMTEPGAGSDVAGTKTRAVRDGDDWILNGSKIYISNGILGDTFVVAAKTDENSRHAMGLFLVERGMPGFERGRNLDKIGLKIQDTAELFFNDVRVPAANVLDDPSRGFYNLMQFLAEERLICAVGSVAHARKGFDTTLEFVTERKAFGKPIAAFQNTRFKMANMLTQINSVCAFVDHCVMEHVEGRLTAEMAAQAKMLASEVEGQVMDECLQLHGGAGYMNEFPIARMYRDARVTRILGGTNEIMREIIARGIGMDERRI